MKVNRTTLAIYRSFFELLEKMDFDEVTINDICQQAMVSRSTFYTYFPDKYELVIFALEQEREQLGLVRGVNIKENIHSLLQHIKDNRNIYQKLILRHTNSELRQMLIVHMQKAFDYMSNDDAEVTDDEKMMKVFYSTGVTGIIMWWMEQNYHLEVEEITNYIYRKLEEVIE